MRRNYPVNELLSEQRVSQVRLQIVKGDITLAETEAIVNAANSHLQHGGGVAAAIVRRGGRIIQEESNNIGFVPEGEAVVTTAGQLAARYVIHTVGPKGGDPQGAQKLRNAVVNSLRRADELNVASISFPAISAGIFGFPKDRCAQILIQTACNYVRQHPGTNVRQIDFVLLDHDTAAIFKRTFQEQSLEYAKWSRG